MKEFIDNYIDITNNEHDRIYKLDFLNKYNSVNNIICSWRFILSDVKRYLRYNGIKRINNKKGVVIGVTWKLVNFHENIHDY